jgi:hypothetical protein
MSQDRLEIPVGAPQSESPALELAKFVGALALLALLMWWSYTYPYPSGKPPSLWSMLAFWGREALIFVFGLVLLLVMLVAWAWKVLVGLLAGLKQAVGQAKRGGNEV